MQMGITKGLVTAVAGASLLGGVGIASLAGPGGGTTLTATTAAATSPAPTTASAPAPSGSSANANCATKLGEWPDFAAGVPKGYEAGAPAGVYLWHNDEGWHLRITHANDHHQVYSGRLVTGGTFVDVTGVKLEGNDHLTVGPDGHTIDFVFNNYGGVDGIDFYTSCAHQIHFGFRGDGHLLTLEEIRIGHDATNPTSNPFVIDRV
jgi:hypothetical protein